MTKVWLSLLIVAATLLAGIWLYLPSADQKRSPTQPQPAATAPVAVQPAAEAESANRPSTVAPGRLLSPVDVSQQRIYTAADPVVAIAQARAVNGDLREIVAATGDIAFVCAQKLDQWGSLTTHGGDKSRMWAAEKLLDRCRNVGAMERPSAIVGPDLPTRIWEKNGREAGIAAALAVVRSSNLAQDLGDAGKVLLETQSLPLDRLFGNDVPALPELAAAWIHASNLIACEATGSCGPDSVRTLGFCINLGCVEGVDLRRAMIDAFSARQMRAIDRLHAWMVAERNGSAADNG